MGWFTRPLKTLLVWGQRTDAQPIANGTFTGGWRTCLVLPFSHIPYGWILQKLRVCLNTPLKFSVNPPNIRTIPKTQYLAFQGFMQLSKGDKFLVDRTHQLVFWGKKWYRFIGQSFFLKKQIWGWVPSQTTPSKMFASTWDHSLSFSTPYSISVIAPWISELGFYQRLLGPLQESSTMGQSSSLWGEWKHPARQNHTFTFAWRWSPVLSWGWNVCILYIFTVCSHWVDPRHSSLQVSLPHHSWKAYEIWRSGYIYMSHFYFTFTCFSCVFCGCWFFIYSTIRVYKNI